MGGEIMISPGRPKFKGCGLEGAVVSGGFDQFTRRSLITGHQSGPLTLDLCYYFFRLR